ncbi:retrovirus-related pol polyprotein from transposon TNT 1-94, partial [Tanacetum coccineum]
VLVTKSHNKTPYELLLDRPYSISFMRPFGCPVTILNTLDPLGKFNGKADEGFLVGYSINSKAFRVFNSRTRKGKLDRRKHLIMNTYCYHSCFLILHSLQVLRTKLDSLLVQQKEGYANSTNRDSTASPSISTVGPSINTAGENINPVQILILMWFDSGDLPKDKRAIGTKWVYRNKKDKRGIIVRNKARLVAQDDAQEIPDEFYGGAHFLLRIATSTPIETNKALNKNEEAEDVDQTIVANSTTKAEYVAAANCCGQVLWIQNQMLDYGFNFMNTKIYIDNENTIYEIVYKEWEDIMERAATTASSFEAEQDSGNINRTQSMATLNESLP